MKVFESMLKHRMLSWSQHLALASGRSIEVVAAAMLHLTSASLSIALKISRHVSTADCRQTSLIPSDSPTLVAWTSAKSTSYIAMNPLTYTSPGASITIL